MAPRPHAIAGRLLGSVTLLLAGCAGVQSALDPGGREADRIATLFWVTTGGAAVIWLVVVVLALRAARPRREADPRRARGLVVWGGIVVPTILLFATLSYSLSLLPGLLAPAPEGSLRVTVVGRQWWWAVHYEAGATGADGPGGARTPRPAAVLANEIHVPVGEPVEFSLESADVIHSFWVPSLGGKVDMLPGRRTRVVLQPTETGVYRGVCAEYCGDSHALMAFDVVVEERADFEAWLVRQAAPALPPDDALARHGAQVFLSSGCGACHAVRGTAADGVIAPDLTHVASRLTIGAGLLGNGRDALEQWFARPRALKPGAHMPAFGMLPRDDLDALAHYLARLR